MCAIFRIVSPVTKIIIIRQFILKIETYFALNDINRSKYIPTDNYLFRAETRAFNFDTFEWML